MCLGAERVACNHLILLTIQELSHPGIDSLCDKNLLFKAETIKTKSHLVSKIK